MTNDVALVLGSGGARGRAHIGGIEKRTTKNPWLNLKSCSISKWKIIAKQN